MIYGVTARTAEEKFLEGVRPRALLAVVTSLAERTPVSGLREVFTAAGRDLASGYVASGQSAPATAQTVLESLGALVTLSEESSQFTIAGEACPLAAVVRHQPEVCELVRRALLAGTTGQPVQMNCVHRKDQPRCRFLAMGHAVESANE